MKTYLAIVLVLGISGCAFKNPMVASPTGDGKYWVLKAPLEYEQPRTKQRIVVPVGFVTDLASVPRLFWTAFPPCGQYTSAAVVHDFLYWNQGPDCDRECADDVLLSAMEESNVDILSRNTIYAAVRKGGQSSWDDNSRAKAGGAIRIVPMEYLPFAPNDTWEEIERRIRDRPMPR